jgi:transposase
LKTWKQSRDPHYEAKKNRVLHLYGLMDGTCDVEPGDPNVVICVDEFGPLTLQPHPGRQWTTRSGGGARPRRRRRAPYTRPHGVRHLLAAYDLSRDRLYGHSKPRKRRGEFLVFCRYLRSLYPSGMRIGLVLDNASAHLSTRKDRRVGQWAAASNVELAYTPTNASYLNRIEGHLAALRYFTLGHARHPDVTAVGVAGQEPEQAVTLLRHGGLLLAGERDQGADGQGGGLTIAADPPGAVDEAVDQ